MQNDLTFGRLNTISLVLLKLIIILLAFAQLQI